MASLFGRENLKRDEWLYLAKLAEKAGRYEEMAYFMRKLVLCTDRPELSHEERELTDEERTLLSLAHKSLVQSLQVAWRASRVAEYNCGINSEYLRLVRAYISKVELELSQRCTTILKLLNSTLIRSLDKVGPPRLKDGESFNDHQSFRRDRETEAFYRIMIGDYNRYLAEIMVGQAWSRAAGDALSSYHTARVLVEKLPATNPTKLSLALNFSVFYYEILKKPGRASGMAKMAHEEAADELVKTFGRGPYAESITTVLMKLLRDNLNTWESEAPEMMDKRPWRPLFFHRL